MSKGLGATTMDITQLAQQITIQLSPYLPHLIPAAVGAVSKMVDGALEHAGGAFAKNIWNRLQGRRSSLDAAAKNVAANPENADAQATLRAQITELLSTDASLVSELLKLLAQRESVVVAAGERS